ncbi:MAG: hypothetical protein ABL897_04695, partial [Hyphomicrobium sp.]
LRIAVQAGAVLAVAGFALVATADAKPRKSAGMQRQAAVTGLAASHDLRREGNRLCFSDHFHYGTSIGQPNVRAAQAAAARSWADFVNFEYGGEWDNYGRSSSKDMQCSQSGAGWGCSVSARPCR